MFGNQLAESLFDPSNNRQKIDLKLPIFRSFRKKLCLSNKPETVTFSHLYEQPLGIFLINKFLASVEALDKAIFFKDVQLFKMINDEKTLKRVARLIYNRYLSSKNSFNHLGQSVFRSHEHSNFDFEHEPTARVLQDTGKSREFIELVENTELFSGNILGLYGTVFNELKKRIQHDDIDRVLFDPVLQIIKRDLSGDLFNRFLNSYFYVYYLKFSEMAGQVSFSDFQPVKILGRGAFGVVRACIKKDTGYNYAVKCISKKRVVATKSYKSIANERKILVELSQTSSRFIVGLNYALFDKNSLYFVLDLMVGGDLKYHLNKEEFFDEERAKFYAAEILLGLEHMHSKDIVYRDLKLENVLLDANGHCRLSDFGLSVQTTRPIRGYAGTPGYTAPEVIRNRYYNKAADFFSFGVLIYRLLSGKKPFESRTGSQGDLDRNVVKLEPKFPKEIFGEAAKGLISNLLEKDPLKRVGVQNGTEEIKKHEWFKSIDWGLLDSGYLDAPYKPNVEEINSQAFHINYQYNDDKYKKVPVSDEFEKKLTNEFYCTRAKSFQKEIVSALKKVDNDTFSNGFKTVNEKSKWRSLRGKENIFTSPFKKTSNTASSHRLGARNNSTFGGATDHKNLVDIIPGGKVENKELFCQSVMEEEKIRKTTLINKASKGKGGKKKRRKFLGIF
eukprot:GAHX01000408.1.p1 GENE.GAHX01000408.1~~GAHX01000408.1.p1  ORF type:complete len:673 (+),score=149.56 GAHX01000408.1:53-2071(+)